MNVFSSPFPVECGAYLCQRLSYLACQVRLTGHLGELSSPTVQDLNPGQPTPEGSRQLHKRQRAQELGGLGVKSWVVRAGVSGECVSVEK